VDPKLEPGLEPDVEPDVETMMVTPKRLFITSMLRL
jgi:hypothetical protein